MVDLFISNPFKIYDYIYIPYQMMIKTIVIYIYMVRYMEGFISPQGDFLMPGQRPFGGAASRCLV